MPISVIIINYNSSAFTLACVKSIMKETSPDIDFEVIVVDNASRHDDFLHLDELSIFPKVKIVKSTLNLGFAGGNMLGVSHTKPSDYYFFLNNDCTLLNDCLNILRDFMQTKPQVGVCTAQTFRPDGSFEPSFSYFPMLGVRLLGSGLMRWFSPKNFPKTSRTYEQSLSIPVATGSAMFVRREVFEEIGGFDTAYFLYCEEEDLCLGMKQAGYTTWLVPEARFTHHGGGSTQRSYAIEREFYISLFIFYRKFLPTWQRGILRLLWAWKNLRKIHKNPQNGRLAWFILKGASPHESLRYTV